MKCKRFHFMYIKALATCIWARFLCFSWILFTILGSSYRCTMCTLPASVCNMCIQGWRLLSQVLVQSTFTIIQVKLFCNSNGDSFPRLYRSPFHKLWMTELSSHPFLLNASLSTMRAKTYCIHFDTVMLVEYCFHMGWPQSHFVLLPPLRVLWLWSQTLVFNVIWNYIFLSIFLFFKIFYWCSSKVFCLFSPALPTSLPCFQPLFVIVLYNCSFTLSPIIPYPYSSGHCQPVLSFSVCGYILLVCMYCWLGSC